MSEYKKLMGYGKKKKKVLKEQPKPKNNSVIDNVKKELNEWHHQPPTEKRWSGAFEAEDGLTEFERKGGKDNINEGPAADYAPYLHAIKQNYDRYWDSVKIFEKQLVKKGLKREAHNIHSFYTKLVTKFHKWFEKFVRKLL